MMFDGESGMNATLCAPDEEKSCFACCPPIRPPDYDHLDYRGFLKRDFLENTRQRKAWGEEIRPITGFSCWALGYLDPGYRRIGCLLHPALHGGRDLRYRVDYGDKCGRETCPEAKTFLLLSPSERRFWLGLSRGLDSFSYSSRRENPLFPLLGWGSSLLALIAEEERGTGLDRAAFFEKYAFFKTDLLPKANAYLLGSVLCRDRIRLLREPEFRERFELFSLQISTRFRTRDGAPQEGTAPHLLDLEPDFKAFLRIHLHRRRIRPSEAGELKRAVKREVDRFRSGPAACL